MHRKIKSFWISLLIISLLLIIVFSPSVVSDGGIYIRPSTYEIWTSLPEEKQISIINFHNDYQKMILVINIKQSDLIGGESAVWLFPVPADPNKADIDILEDIPHLGGNNIIDIAKDQNAESFAWMYFSQLYSIPIGSILSYFFDSDNRNTYNFGTSMKAEGEGDGDGERVTIYEHVEEMGLTTELVGTNDTIAFNNYLLEKNLNLSNQSLSIVDEYLGQDYSFVVSWISNITKFIKEATVLQYSKYYNNYDEPFYVLGVYIKFPTDKIYYPLKLTSIYGEERIPILIQILNYVSLEPSYLSDDDIRIDYYLDKSYRISSDNSNLTEFFSGFEISKSRDLYDWDAKYVKNVKYTEMTINTESKNFKDDLWFENDVPSDVSKYDFFISYGFFISILIFIFISCLASLMAGLITFKHSENFSKTNFFLIGLGNFATLIGLILILKLLNIDKNNEKLENENQKNNYDVPTKVIMVIIVGFLIVLYMSVYFYISILLDPFVCMTILSFPFFISIMLIVFLLTKYKNIRKFVILFTLLFLCFTYLFQYGLSLII